MAVFVEGVPCAVCGKPVLKQSGQTPILFPPFVPNEADPLIIFRDSVVHEACFRNHPLSERALVRIAELEEASREWPPTCVQCGTKITDPDEHFTFGHLTDDARDELYKFNYAHLHLRCLPELPELAAIHRMLLQLGTSGKWKGPAFDWLMGHLEQALNERSNAQSEAATVGR